MKKIIILIVLLFSLSIIAQEESAGVEEEPPAADAPPNVKSVSENIIQGDILYEDDTIIVGAGASCDIKQKPEDDALVHLQENTTFSMTYAFIDGKSKSVYSNEGGHSKHIINGLDDEDSLMYLSPVVAVGISGTKFDMIVEKDGSTRIIVAEGKVIYRINIPDAYKRQPYFLGDSKSYKIVDNFLSSKKQELSNGNEVYITRKAVDDFLKDAEIYESYQNPNRKELENFDKNLNEKEFKKKLEDAYSKFIKLTHKKAEVDKDVYEEFILIDDLKRLEEEIHKNPNGGFAIVKKYILDLRNREKQHIHDLLTRIKKSGKDNTNTSKDRIYINQEKPILFSPGSVRLNKQAIRNLKNTIKKLKEFPNAKIYIEGYADPSPIQKSGFKDNWELSASRALSVLRYIIKQTKMKAERFSIIGAGVILRKV